MYVCVCVYVRTSYCVFCWRSLFVGQIEVAKQNAAFKNNEKARTGYALDLTEVRHTNYFTAFPVALRTTTIPSPGRCTPHSLTIDYKGRVLNRIYAPYRSIAWCPMGPTHRSSALPAGPDHQINILCAVVLYSRSAPIKQPLHPRRPTHGKYILPSCEGKG